MKVAILCGGVGSRLSKETSAKPKPMVQIGGRPILWHLMNGYAAHSFNDFALALGYKGEVIKEYFLRYHVLNGDFAVNLADGSVVYEEAQSVDWSVGLYDTGLSTMTGGRLARLDSVIKPSGTFMLTYGDGLSDVDLTALLDYHRSSGRMATVTTVRPPARFGNMILEDGHVTEFKEKPQTEVGWINGGFFVFEPEVFDYLDGDDSVLEGRPLERLAAEGQLAAFRHEGGWQCMDTLRDKHHLEDLWRSAQAFWKTW